MRLLLIEDDADLGEGMADGLRAEGYAVEWVLNGSDGLYRAREWDWDLIVLDRLLPDLDGLAVLGGIRKVKTVPVLMLTALDQVEHRLEGLDGGADDYLGKPFEFRELLSRLRALARRAYHGTGRELAHGDLVLNSERRCVFRRGEELVLSAAEFGTLEYLMLRRGRVVSRRRLEDLLGEDGAEVSPNSLDVHLHRLRAKVGRDVIVTRRGQGYLIPEKADENGPR